MKKIYSDAELPVFELLVDDTDETGMRLISLVDKPAIGVEGMAFSELNVEEYMFKNIEDKQIIVGPLLIPDIKIKRKDNDGNLYFGVMSRDTIMKMVEKFLKLNDNKLINIDHTSTICKSAYIQQNWFIEDSIYDKSRLYGYKLPVGTYFLVVKIDDKVEWDEYVKAGGLYSFSMEGFLGRYMKFSYNDMIDGLSDEELEDIFRDIF